MSAEKNLKRAFEGEWRYISHYKYPRPQLMCLQKDIPKHKNAKDFIKFLRSKLAKQESK